MKNILRCLLSTIAVILLTSFIAILYMALEPGLSLPTYFFFYIWIIVCSIIDGFYAYHAFHGFKMWREEKNSFDDDILDDDIIEAIILLGRNDLKDRLQAIHEEVAHRNGEQL